jgi:Uma2 family endonuclease
VRIPAYDEPEPDISIVPGANADYRSRVPDPADVAMLVEVSDWTPGTDRGLKLAAYAKDGIAVYWIVNLVDRQVEVYTRPTKAGRYRSRKDYKPGQQVPVVIAGQQLRPIAVDDILP